MAYVECFAAPVPTANREVYRAHAAKMANDLREARGQVMECWRTNVPGGEVTSYPMAVQLKDDETVVGLMRWLSKDVRDSAFERLRTDPRMREHMGEMPSDGKRMFFGGFQPIVDE